MKELLAAKTLDEAEIEDEDSEQTTDDFIREQVKARGPQKIFLFCFYSYTKSQNHRSIWNKRRKRKTKTI